MTNDQNPTTEDRDHSRCRFSTDLEGNVTAGRGGLSGLGEWEFPCEECADRVNRTIRNADRTDTTDGTTPFPHITRVEVIDDQTGRLLVRYDLSDVQLSIQDTGRTMKVFCRNAAHD